MGNEQVRAVEGRLDARALFDDHVDAVFRYAARRVGATEARDVAAEVFRIALERLDTYEPERGSPRAWLVGIATNVVRNQWRQERRRLAALGRLDPDDSAPDDTAAVLDQVDADRRVRLLLVRVGKLSPEDRDMLVLVAWERLPHREVAEALGIPVGTVGSRLHRIREFLRRGDSDE